MSPPHAFADLGATPRAHLGVLFYQAVWRLAEHVGPAAERDWPFLASYLGELRARIPAGPDLIGPLEAATAEWLESAAAQSTGQGSLSTVA